jgi:uncharacterized membrane protein
MSTPQPRVASNEFARGLLASLPLKLHWIYLVIAIPLLIFLAIWTPPFQSPDETEHFCRAYRVARGGFWGGSGGYVDSGINQLDSYTAALPFNSNARFTAAEQAGAADVKWTGQMVFRESPNTSLYPPTGYLPQALGVDIGKAAGMGVMQTLELARLLNGAFAILICTLSLYWSRGGKVVMFTMLLMPMTLFLFASCNQDTMLIALTCLAFAIISKHIDTEKPISMVQAAVLAVSLLILSMGRPPYAALAIVILSPSLLPQWRRKPAWLPGMLLASLSVAATLIWWKLALASSHGYAHSASKFGFIDAKQQLQNLMQHPGIIPALASFTFNHSVEYVAGVIGYLGWLDTPMPSLYYLVMVVVMLMACLAELSDRGKMKTSVTILLLASSLVAGAGVFLIEYLTWTPVGAHAIYGVQGRYFIPLAIAVGVGLPHFAAAEKTCQRASAFVVLSQLLTVVCLPQVIMARYYQG